MNIYPIEIDIEVYDIDLELFEKLMESINAKGVGKSFFVYKWEEFDISLPRIESKVGIGHRGFNVTLTDNPKKASSRRDFTMNSLMLNIYTLELLDFYGGVEDIKNCKIKIIDENKFKEDSLRVLRSIQFSSRFAFHIDSKSLKVIQKISLDDISLERVYIELMKMFNSKHLHYGLFYLFKTLVAKKLFKLELTFKEFFQISKEFIKYQKYFDTKMQHLYFLYIFASKKYISFKIIGDIFYLSTFNKKDYKKLSSQKRYPKSYNIRFVYGIAIKYPLILWLGNYRLSSYEKGLDIYKNRLISVNSKDVIADGFKGESISKEIKAREIKYIRSITI